MHGTQAQKYKQLKLYEKKKISGRILLNSFGSEEFNEDPYINRKTLAVFTETMKTINAARKS